MNFKIKIINIVAFVSIISVNVFHYNFSPAKFNFYLSDLNDCNYYFGKLDDNKKKCGLWLNFGKKNIKSIFYYKNDVNNGLTIEFKDDNNLCKSLEFFVVDGEYKGFVYEYDEFGRLCGRLYVENNEILSNDVITSDTIAYSDVSKVGTNFHILKMDEVLDMCDTNIRVSTYTNKSKIIILIIMIFLILLNVFYFKKNNLFSIVCAFLISLIILFENKFSTDNRCLLLKNDTMVALGSVDGNINHKEGFWIFTTNKKTDTTFLTTIDRVGYYKNNLKDSLWTYYCSDTFQINLRNIMLKESITSECLCYYDNTKLLSKNYVKNGIIDSNFFVDGNINTNLWNGIEKSNEYKSEIDNFCQYDTIVYFSSLTNKIEFIITILVIVSLILNLFFYAHKKMSPKK